MLKDKISVRRHVVLAFLLASSGLATAGVQACDSCAVAVQLPINTGLQVGQIAMTAAAVVAAIGAAGGGDGSATNGAALASEDAAISSSEHSTFVDMFVMNNKVRAENTNNMQSMNCRLSTKNTIGPAMEQAADAAKKMEERGIVDGMFFNPGMTPQRIAVGALYRLCQNGQLAPDDFGKNWFDTNQCIDDPTTAHDFLKISTILDSPVLIPPPQATLNTLNNPEASTPPAVLTAWNSLNDKQKKWVGATRYCENLVLNKIKPQSVRGDSAMSTSGMGVIAQNLSAASALFSARDVCIEEKNRRTALDSAGLPAGQQKTDIQRIAPKLTSFLMNKRGGDPRKFYAYTNLANYNANNAILDGGQPKAWISEYVINLMNRDHGLSIECVNYADQGPDAEKTGNAIACAQMALAWEKNEAQRKKNFIEAVTSINQAPQPVEAGPTQTRANYNPNQPKQVPMLQDAALDVPGFDQRPMRLEEMLQTYNAVEHPERSVKAETELKQP